MLPAVVMFVYNDVLHDARVWREARTLLDAGHEVTVIALQTGGLPADERPLGIRVLRVGGSQLLPGTASPFWLGLKGSWLAKLRWLLGYIRGLWDWRNLAAATALEGLSSPVVWHAHDLTGLVSAMQAQRNHPGLIVYDSHELYLEAGSVSRLPRPLRYVIAIFEGRLARRADAVITVSDSIANEMQRRLRISRPTVVLNCPPLGPEPIDRTKSPLRRQFDLGDRPILIHHGTISLGRGIRETVKALDHLPPDVALVLLGNGELVPEMKALANDEYAGRLFMHPPVPRDDLWAWIGGADVSIMAIEGINLNYYYSAPNKLFESLCAGVPVVVSDFPEMARVVQETGAGMVVDPTKPESIARAVSHILDANRVAPGHLRSLCRLAARQRYSWERESAVLLALYKSLIAGNRHRR